MEVSKEVQTFIEQNIDLIEKNTKESWEEIYKKNFPVGFTKILLECGENPLEQGLNYIPKNFLFGSNIKEFIIPDNVTRIGKNAFTACTSLTSVVIGNSVKDIDKNAFTSCILLTNIEIPSSVISIGYCAFSNCMRLTNIVIGDSVKSIGEGAFSWCNLLTSIEIPNSVTSIGDSAFYYCTSLTNVTIPNSVTSIGENAFSNCTSLKEIKYLGTKREAMQLGIRDRSNTKWIMDSSIEKIICTDGVVNL